VKQEPTDQSRSYGPLDIKEANVELKIESGEAEEVMEDLSSSSYDSYSSNSGLEESPLKYSFLPPKETQFKNKASTVDGITQVITQ
jgi:hypothetical protein